MARSAYIYLVRIKATGTLIGAFTVKHEARTWTDRWRGGVYLLDDLQLSRMPDGGYANFLISKEETKIEWEK